MTHDKNSQGRIIILSGCHYDETMDFLQKYNVGAHDTVIFKTNLNAWEIKANEMIEYLASAYEENENAAQNPLHERKLPRCILIPGNHNMCHAALVLGNLGMDEIEKLRELPIRTLRSQLCDLYPQSLAKTNEAEISPIVNQRAISRLSIDNFINEMIILLKSPTSLEFTAGNRTYIVAHGSQIDFNLPMEAQDIDQLFGNRYKVKKLEEKYAQSEQPNTHQGPETIIFGDRNGFYRQILQYHKDGKHQSLPEWLEKNKEQIIVSPSNKNGGRLIDNDTSRGNKQSAIIITPPQKTTESPKEEFIAFDFKRLPNIEPLSAEWKISPAKTFVQSLSEKTYHAYSDINPYSSPQNLEKYLQGFKNNGRKQREESRINRNIEKGKKHLGSGGWIVSTTHLHDRTIEHRIRVPRKAGDHFPCNKRQTEYPQGMGGHQKLG